MSSYTKSLNSPRADAPIARTATTSAAILDGAAPIAAPASGVEASADLEDDLAGAARFDRTNGVVVLLERKTMRDDGRRIELARAQKARHHEPGVVHAAPDDAIDGETLEHDLRREVDVDRFGRDAEH